MNKRYFLILLILISTNSYACCGCAVVNSSLKNLDNT